MSDKKYPHLNKNLQAPDRDPDYKSKRGIPYWWAPEWMRTLNNGKTISRIIPLKTGQDQVDLHMVSKEGKLSYIQGSIQREFKRWHEDNGIDWLLLGIEEEEMLTPEWLEDNDVHNK